MKKILTFLAVLSIFGSMITNIFAQEHKCLHDTIYSLTVSPIALPVAIPTKGWNYDSTSSTELDFLPDNGWNILDNYHHKNANNGFSNDTSYWDLDNGILKLYLKDDSITTLNGSYAFTAAILKRDFINFSYGYYEVRVKPPYDTTLCSSFWGIEGSGPDYREIDNFEYFTKNLHSNIYHKYDTTSAYYGEQMFFDTSYLNTNDWIVYGFEWLPETYSFYINNHFISSRTFDNSCVEKNFSPIKHWMLWIVNWVYNSDPLPPFPKVLKADYIRIYYLKTNSINYDFYDNWSNYDYGVWHTVRLGNAYSAIINDNGRHSVWATSGVTLDKGFEVSLGTEFDARIYK